ncbi:putative motility protein [Campylobacter sp. TTU-622]|uniref:putative motility protein n=1 Tax=unclassified Campylobacter TaxID=2593542 RepID=UPI001906A19A|nr:MULTISPECIES: putative motility protein [unclassified Campylobacter]MBK1971103.1 putative motility protein [Campylobacter sp. TTU_617]MBK1973393.1 putative motility protein [Campylobacter sp. TTU-622]MBK1992137.1 putative motility protein [Campylobacter sp. 2018MI34]
MISDISNASLMATINTSLLKKTMDSNEALMAELINGLEAANPQGSIPTNSSQPALNSNLDIYA